MGLNFFFSRDSRDYSRYPVEQPVILQKMPNPDPSNFIIKDSFSHKGYRILWVNYPDCTNYEGDKILVYPPSVDVSLLVAKNKLDPHFFNLGDSPIARFEPTKKGWVMAQIFVYAYSIKIV